MVTMGQDVVILMEEKPALAQAPNSNDYDA